MLRMLGSAGAGRSEHTGLLSRLLPQGSTEAVGLQAGLDDVCPIGEPIKHGLAEPGVG